MIKNHKNNNALFKGALILSMGGLLTKVLGAIYRIPLTNLLGAEGIGVYQMVFPLYSLLLTVSSTGVPSGISKLIASGEDAENVLKTSLLIFVPLGLIGSVFLMAFSRSLATLQGNINAKWAYVLISPSVVLVSIICCFRGYFQGYVNMKPTAVSQILEQSIKLLFGLILVYVFRANTVLSACLATLAVTISEGVTCIYFFFLKKKSYNGFNIFAKNDIKISKVIKKVFPVMLSTLILPLSKTIESFFIINVLNSYTASATSLYGLYSGAVESLVSVPVSVCYGIAITSIPIIASLKKQNGNYLDKSRQSVFLTLILSTICGVGFYFLSPLAVKILYNRLPNYEKLIVVNMLKLASCTVAILPIMQTLTAVLIAIEKVYISTLSITIASILKIILSITLLKIPQLNIFAVVYTDIICYLVACFFDLVYIIKDGIKLEKSFVRRQYE